MTGSSADLAVAFGSQPGAPPSYSAFLSTGLSSAARVRLGFAYASQSGLEKLLGQVGEAPRWDESSKQWIVGLHRGITEPSAIPALKAVAKSEVRVYAGGPRLTYSSLLTGPKFHAKVIAVADRATSALSTLLCTSANLTSAAIGDDSTNYEFGVGLNGSVITPKVSSRFDAWWTDVWGKSLPATDALIDQYTKLRTQYFTRNPDTILDVDPPSDIRLGTAQHFWILMGKGSGKDRNGIDLSKNLALYFGDILYGTKLLRMRCGTAVRDDRTLTSKTTTFGVEQWRLSFITSNQGGPRYADRVVHLTRRTDSRGEFYDLVVADEDSPTHRAWRRCANRLGYLGQTSGKREFGFY